MKKVMVFGTFDVLHPGHKYFLRHAKRQGKFLVAVIARDLTVKRVKKRFPLNMEMKRLKAVQELGIADKVILGNITDKYAVIEAERPAVIALGYDQKEFTGELEKELGKRNVPAEIIRINSYMPQKYKSSKIIAGIRARKKG